MKFLSGSIMKKINTIQASENILSYVSVIAVRHCIGSICIAYKTASMGKKNAIHSFIIHTNITVLFFRDSLIKL